MAEVSNSSGRDPLRSRIPVTVITGFLGSGKTTLLNALLQCPEAANTAVIINEFGEIGVDNDLVLNVTESMTLLDNGCVCCVLRGDLEQALLDMFTARRAGGIASFERVILETTGLADPAPIMQTLISDPMLALHYRLDGVVTLVDSVQGLAQLKDNAEAVKQAAVADRLVITKSDLAGPQAVEELANTLKRINPSARHAIAIDGKVDPTFVLAVGLDRVRVQPEAVERWLGDAPSAHGEHHHHTHDISTFTLFFDEPFEKEVFERCVDVLASLRGADLLRVKGLVNVVGENGPVIVQGVQHLFHPPVTLAAWPSADKRSRLVFITRKIERKTVADLFSAIAAIKPA